MLVAVASGWDQHVEVINKIIPQHWKVDICFTIWILVHQILPRVPQAVHMFISSVQRHVLPGVQVQTCFTSFWHQISLAQCTKKSPHMPKVNETGWLFRIICLLLPFLLPAQCDGVGSLNFLLQNWAWFVFFSSRHSVWSTHQWMSDPIINRKLKWHEFWCN